MVVFSSPKDRLGLFPDSPWVKKGIWSLEFSKQYPGNLICLGIWPSEGFTGCYPIRIRIVVFIRSVL